MQLESDAQCSDWGVLREHLRARYDIIHEAAEAVSVQRQNQAITIAIRPVTVGAAPWIELRADLMSADGVPPTPFLQRNFNLPVGACATAAGVFVLRQLLPLTVTHSALDDALLTLTERLARTLTV